MPEIGDASMAKKGVPFRTDDISEVRSKFQGRIFFEKTLPATFSLQSKLALPYTFVQEHGDKFRKAVILRSKPSTQPWDVNLTVTRDLRGCTQVRFSGGWKAFATFHGLLAGEKLIFLLTAMSEFKVHIFPGTQNPKRCPSQASRVSLDEFEPSRKQEPSYGNRDEQMANERVAEVMLKSNGLFVMKKLAVEAEHAVSASGCGSTSNSLSFDNGDSVHHHTSENVQEPAFDYVERMVSGVTGNEMSERRDASIMAKRGRMPVCGDEKTKLLRRLQGTIYFETTLSTSNLSLIRDSELIIPSWFVKEHGDKFWTSVFLRSESSTKTWPVMLNLQSKPPRVALSEGWKAFADFNNLSEGELLVFSLTAMSQFEVYRFPGTRSHKRQPEATRAPRKRLDGSEKSSRKAAEQTYECKDEQNACELNGGILQVKTILK